MESFELFSLSYGRHVAQNAQPTFYCIHETFKSSWVLHPIFRTYMQRLDEKCKRSFEHFLAKTKRLQKLKKRGKIEK